MNLRKKIKIFGIMTMTIVGIYIAVINNVTSSPWKNDNSLTNTVDLHLKGKGILTSTKDSYLKYGNSFSISTTYNNLNVVEYKYPFSAGNSWGGGGLQITKVY